jgi:DNA-directed RNA polymerase subunit RPC12/RpoP
MKKTSNQYHGVVKCQFCGAQVDGKELADHAKRYHTGAHNTSALTNSKTNLPMEKLESTKPVVVSAMRHFFIDQSGILVNPKYVREEIKMNGDDQPRGVSRGKGANKQRHVKARKAKPAIDSTSLAGVENPGKRIAFPIPPQSRSSDNSFREKVEWLNTLSNLDKTKNIERYGFVRCPDCKARLKPAKLDKHRHKVHSVQPRVERAYPKLGQLQKMTEKSTTLESGRLISCPHCTAKVKSTRLQKHLAKVHPGRNLLNARTEKLSKPMQSNKSKRQMKSPNNAGLSWKENQTNDLEALRQSFQEPRDGSKELGHMRREGDGKFGSYPLHDDYSDESEA